MDSLLKAIGAFSLICFLIIGGTVFNGWIAFNFYEWFVRPVFPSAPVITVSGFIGISFFVALFISRTDKIKDEYKKDQSTQVIEAVLGPLFTLLIGYIAYCILY